MKKLKLREVKDLPMVTLDVVDSGLSWGPHSWVLHLTPHLQEEKAP